MSKSMKVGESITFCLSVIGGGYLLRTFGKHIDSGLLMMFGIFGIFGGILSFFINLIQRAAEKHERGEDTGIWKPLVSVHPAQ